ncbi:AraC family transcriptional regulator [Dyadobacter psychrotolerans]|uniref:AraC family transcriptional regulator n=1 Tax=Dyadobacter psychrotolerans TaxID=2541721 RepID=A0A4R5DIA6_9BACT|nr:AraC family transcriptional regulator [Dyadobacter psychrotolerans]TDE11644.1 AraC family transcriptional regulator [Dyadobacter psychrotolerans]
MKAPIHKNIESQVRTVTVQELRESHFDPNWHFHPHYQLFTVLEGTGKRLIGDSIHTFEPGDTVFLGPDIPHLWRSDSDYFNSESELFTHGIVLYFQEDFLGKDFLDRQEMLPLRQLFIESKRGIAYKGPLRDHIRAELQGMLHEEGFQSILRLMTLLDRLAHQEGGTPISSYGYVNTYKVSETERMQKVHSYVLQHFSQDIRLGDVASLAGMSEAAFCRYFKARSNKTFIDFVNEIRIGHACKLLLEDQWTIAQIAYDSGFDSLSNFNRNFKRYIGHTPREYKGNY